MINYTVEKIVDEITKVIKGKREVVLKIVMAVLAKGHILMEDIPGVGKTTLANSLAKTMTITKKRMQFTPDVMPSDITGYSYFNPATKEVEFRKGPIMCNLFLADEINRTSSRTQAALLEAMEESQVTVDGKTQSMYSPFIVIATENPLGAAGTQMLPDSELDRFMIQVSLGYPDNKSEVEMLKVRNGEKETEEVNNVISKNKLIAMQKEVKNVYISDAVYEYMVLLADTTRNHKYIENGISPRGTIDLMYMAKACAFANNRDYVIPEDVKEVFPDVVRHRIILKGMAYAEKKDKSVIIESVLKTVPMPKIVNERG